MVANIHSLYQKVSNESPVAAHEGEMTEALIGAFLAKVEASLVQGGENAKKVKKVYNILVEVLQNLFHHQAVPPQDFLDSLPVKGLNTYTFCVMCRESKSGYRIVCGNFIAKEKCVQLKKRLEKLNSLTQDQLKELYMTILNNEEFSEKGGGGLGFIDMARKSGNKFVYHFIDFDSKFNFFVFEVLVN